MVDTGNTWNISGGMDVVGVDDEKVGEVADVQGDFIVVSKGFFFPTDYYVPTNAITSVSDKVYLNVTKDEALNQGWDVEPNLDTTRTYPDDRIVDAGLHIDNPVPDASEVRGEASDQPFEHRADDSARHIDDNETVRVQLTEEEIAAGTRKVERGAIHVDTVVTEEQQSLDVPVTEEHVTVNRRSVDRDVEPGDTTFQEGTIEVPVRGEEVVVEKQAHVVEEVEIGKEQVTETQRVTDTVRREEARIRDEQGNVIEDGDSTSRTSR